MTWSVKPLLVSISAAALAGAAMPILLGTTPASADAARDPGFSGYSSLASSRSKAAFPLAPTIRFTG